MAIRKISLLTVMFDRVERNTLIAALRMYSAEQKHGRDGSPAEHARADALISKIFAAPILTAEIDE